MIRDELAGLAGSGSKLLMVRAEEDTAWSGFGGQGADWLLDQL